MNWNCGVAAIWLPLMFTGVMAGYDRSSSSDVGNVAEERREGSVSQGKQVEEVRQAFLKHQQLFRDLDIDGIIDAHDVKFVSQRFNGNPEEALEALREQQQSFSDRVFEIVANAEIDKIEIAPEEVRSAYEADEDNDLYLVHAADSLWLFHRTAEDWKTLGTDFEGEIAEELNRPSESR